MQMHRWPLAVTLALALAIALPAADEPVHPLMIKPDAKPAFQAWVESVNPAKRTVTVWTVACMHVEATPDHRKNEVILSVPSARLVNLPVWRGGKVTQKGKPLALADLKPGMRVMLETVVQGMLLVKNVEVVAEGEVEALAEAQQEADKDSK
jgi:hypothetical protein